MQAVPSEVWATLERRLDEARVPSPQRADYRKWVRFYFDFCTKYGHPVAAPASRGPFLAKLASKNQSVAQRRQASAAVGLLLQPASRAPEPGASPPPPTVAPAIPRPPLYSQPSAPRGDAPAGPSPDRRLPLASSNTPGSARGLGSPPPTPGKPPQPDRVRPADAPAAPRPDIAVPGAPHPSPPSPGRGASWQQEYSDLEAAILLRNYSRRTLEAYRFWIGKFQSFVRSRPTGELGPQEVRGFLSDLAVVLPGTHAHLYS